MVREVRGGIQGKDFPRKKRARNGQRELRSSTGARVPAPGLTAAMGEVQCVRGGVVGKYGAVTALSGLVG